MINQWDFSAVALLKKTLKVSSVRLIVFKHAISMLQKIFAFESAEMFV